VLGCERELDAVLPQVVGCGNLAAEAVTAQTHEHFAGIVRESLNQYRYVETRKPDGIRRIALVSEVRQCDDDAIDFPGVLPEEISTLAGILQGFN
jgi:hypothetical protein